MVTPKSRTLFGNAAFLYTVLSLLYYLTAIVFTAADAKGKTPAEASSLPFGIENLNFKPSNCLLQFFRH